MCNLKKTVLIISIFLASLFSAPIEQNVGYSFAPASVLAQTEFSLQLYSSSFDWCTSVFSHKTASVSENVITLTFVHNQLDIACAAIWDPTPSGPVFDLPQLKPGKYLVYAKSTYSCLIEPPYCRMPEPAPVLVDTLTVEEDNQTGDFWYLSATEYKDGNSFDLQILNPSLGNCNTSFRNISADVMGNKITLNFVTDFKDVICFVDIHPHGPVFEMKDVPDGEYEVYYADWPACAYPICDVEPCAVCDIWVNPMYAGNINVGTTSIRKNVKQSNAGVEAVQSGHTLKFFVPGGVNLTRAELYNMNGEQLGFSMDITALTENSFETSVPEELSPGNYILKTDVSEGIPLSFCFTIAK